MKDLMKEIRGTGIPEGSVGIWWIGQAGFAFKSAGGTVMFLDVYLSNAVEELAGFKRLSLAPIDAEDVRADWLISTHEHPDHLDIGALNTIIANNPGCMFAGAADCVSVFDEYGIANDRRLIMTPGNSYELGDVKVYAQRADHGELAPDALSLLFDFGKVRVMFTGDTAFTMDYLQPLMDMKPDVVIPCINGSFGNLNGTEAAQVVAAAKPRVAIPCHFWTFMQHHVVPGGDPHTFIEACGQLSPSTQTQLLMPGQGLLVTGDEAKVI